VLARLTTPESQDDPLIAVLFENVPFGALVIDREGRALRVNQALRDLAGEDADLAPGVNAAALFAGEGHEVMWQDLRHWLRGRPGPVFNMPARLAIHTAAVGESAGRMVAVRVGADLLRGADGEIEGALLRITDVTLQTELEAQLAHSQKLQAVGQLAGGIAHDFNNLLTTVLGAAESIETRPGIDAETLEDAALIQSGARRGAALVRQLLAFGRQQTMQPRSLAVNHVINDLSILLRRIVGDKVRLSLDLETPGRSVRADPTQLDQVLVNLVVNARDAMPDGGVVTLRSGHMTLYRPLARGPETIPPGRYVMIEVADTGAGIPPEVLPRIFDPFFTTKRDRGGNGLGLSMVHGIVRQSDGFVTVESEPGQGTRFKIYLPRWDEREAVQIPSVPVNALAPAEPAEPLRPQPSMLRPTILLVEDEEQVRRLAERSLRRRGWDVVAADSGEAALAQIDRMDLRVSAVVTDMVMPGMDGARLLRALRARRGLEKVPAVLVSGYADESLRRELDAAQTVFLPKPYLPQELADRVAQVMAAQLPSTMV
jgi:two-component system cell cycle sensor histidine kinase/response regulator CckA